MERYVPPISFTGHSSLATPPHVTRHHLPATPERKGPPTFWHLGNVGGPLRRPFLEAAVDGEEKDQTIMVEIR